MIANKFFLLGRWKISFTIKISYTCKLDNLLFFGKACKKCKTLRNGRTSKKDIKKLTSITLSIGVSSISFGTSAHRVMRPGSARSLARARVLHNTRIDTVFVDTGLILWTLRVIATFRSGLNCTKKIVSYFYDRFGYSKMYLLHPLQNKKGYISCRLHALYSTSKFCMFHLENDFKRQTKYWFNSDNIKETSSKTFHQQFKIKHLIWFNWTL